MSGLRVPGLGPIVGHTTDRTCRLWIRAGDPEDEGALLDPNRRSIGVIALVNRKRVVRTGGKPIAYYFRLQREFDRTGTFVLGGDCALGRHPSDGIPESKQDKPHPLEPDTVYTVRMATLTLDDPMPDDESLGDRELAARLPPIAEMARLLLDLPADRCEATFRTFPTADAIADKLSFLIGSCRYPGFLWKVKEADRIFGPMRAHLEGGARAGENGGPARFTMMMGDQIYADMLNKAIPLFRADSFQEFQDRYKEAFGSPHMRLLLRSAPTYMILDDHEIEDNWTQDRLGTQHRLFTIAIGAYMSYQWSHGPRNGRRLFYDFSCAGYPFFVLDTRTQRFKDDALGLRDNHLLGRPSIDPASPSQLDVLLDWLSSRQDESGDAPKFIVTSSVFAPCPISERVDPALDDDAKRRDDPDAILFEANRKRREGSDSWPAYPNTRRSILQHIVDRRIQNVVFLSGDIHCANIARMRFEKNGTDLGLFAYDVTSSAFYWPFPFADGDPNHYVHDSQAPGQNDVFPLDGAEMNYVAWGFTQLDNFCRLEVDQASSSLTVRVFDRDGKRVEVHDAQGVATERSVLRLSPW